MLIEDQTKTTKRTGRPTKEAQAMKDLIDSASWYDLDASIKNDINQQSKTVTEKTDQINKGAGNKDQDLIKANNNDDDKIQA